MCVPCAVLAAPASLPRDDGPSTSQQQQQQQQQRRCRQLRNGPQLPTALPTLCKSVTAKVTAKVHIRDCPVCRPTSLVCGQWGGVSGALMGCDAERELLPRSGRWGRDKLASL